MSGLLAGLRRFLRQYPADFYWVGYSGGADSHVLLHLCAQLKRELGPIFGAVHVNHGLNPSASRWAEHCARVCAELDLPVKLIAVDARPPAGASPEEAARNARYRALAEWLEPNAILLLAHHQDDQAETVLLQLLRGAGPAGLAGMPQEASLGRGRLLRPLLEVPRAALLDYARRFGLAFIDDPSNFEETFDRNYLRHRILPLLKARWPACARTIARSARHCFAAQQLVEKALAKRLEAALDEAGSLDLTALASLDRPEQRWLVREWIKRQGFRPPAAMILERILEEAVPAKPDRQPRIEWAEGVVCRYRGRLYALRPTPPPAPNWRAFWDGKTPLVLPDASVLEPSLGVGVGIAARWWRQGEIEVRYRRGGERCRLPKRGNKSLKKLCQEQGIPAWVRARLPLIYLAGQLAAVANLWICEPFAAGPEEEGVILAWKQRSKQLLGLGKDKSVEQLGQGKGYVKIN